MTRPEGGGDENDLIGFGEAIAPGAARLDPIVPADQPDRLAGMLRDRGADVTVCWQVSGHTLAPTEIVDAARWFQMHSPPGAASFSHPNQYPEN